MNDFINSKIDTKSTIFVHKNAFVDIVRSLTSTIEDIKIKNNKTEIEFVQNNKNVVYFIFVEIKSGCDVVSKLNLIHNKVETHTKLLINKKPHNIIINFFGEF